MLLAYKNNRMEQLKKPKNVQYSYVASTPETSGNTIFSTGVEILQP